VHVERHADRHVGRDAAYAREELALAVVVALGDHGAVQVEEHRVAALHHGVQDPARHVFVGRALHRTARRRAAGDRQHDFGAGFFRELDEGADPRARALERRADFLPLQRRRAPASKARQVRGHRRESVGFVLHLGNDEAHGGPGKGVWESKSPMLGCPA
jgi:hypothetical protein